MQRGSIYPRGASRPRGGGGGGGYCGRIDGAGGRTITSKQVAEELAQVGVVGLVVEAQGAAVLEVGGELHGEALAEHLDGRGHLLLADLLVLLLLRSRLQPLPGQRSPQEVHEHVSQGLDVVPAALLDPQVGVDGSIAGRARQVLVLSVRNVDVRLGVPVLLGQPKVDDVHLWTTESDEFMLAHVLAKRQALQLQKSSLSFDP